MALNDKLSAMMKKKPAAAPAGKYDDPTDELTQPPHNEPDADEGYVNDIMGKDIMGESEVPFQGDPLEGALIDAGYEVTPEQLMQIQSILKPAPAAPKAPVGAAPGAAKPPFAGQDKTKPAGMV